ncbi:hypothetical protein JCM6882_001839 [Rhodosporidiobolus microsporus]
MLDRLPDKALDRILRLLGPEPSPSSGSDQVAKSLRACTLVCKAVKVRALPLLWETVIFRSRTDVEQVTHLDFAGVILQPFNPFIAPCPTFRRLTHLSIVRSGALAGVFPTLLTTRKLPALRTLDLCDVSECSTDAIFPHIEPDLLDQLDMVQLSQNRRLGDLWCSSDMFRRTILPPHIFVTSCGPDELSDHEERALTVLSSLVCSIPHLQSLHLPISLQSFDEVASLLAELKFHCTEQGVEIVWREKEQGMLRELSQEAWRWAKEFKAKKKAEAEVEAAASIEQEAC